MVQQKNSPPPLSRLSSADEAGCPGPYDDNVFLHQGLIILLLRKEGKGTMSIHLLDLQIFAGKGRVQTRIKEDIGHKEAFMGAVALVVLDAVQYCLCPV